MILGIHSKSLPSGVNFTVLLHLRAIWKSVFVFLSVFERFRDFVRPFWVTKGEAQEFLGDILGWAGGMRSRGEDSRRGEESQARRSGQEKLGKAIRSGRELGKNLSRDLARHPRKAGAADTLARIPPACYSTRRMKD